MQVSSNSREEEEMDFMNEINSRKIEALLTC
jgi:hypothetical protein